MISFVRLLISFVVLLISFEAFLINVLVLNKSAVLFIDLITF